MTMTFESPKPAKKVRLVVDIEFKSEQDFNLWRKRANLLHITPGTIIKTDIQEEKIYKTAEQPKE